MEFNPLPDLLNNGFTIHRTVLFYGDRYGSENMQIPDFFDKMAIFI